MSLVVLGNLLQLLAFVLSEYLEGMQLDCQTSAKNYRLYLPTALSLTPLKGLLSLSSLTF